MRLLILALLTTACLAQEEWYGLYVREYGEKKVEVYYVLGTVDTTDLQALKSGVLKDGFLEVRNLCRVDPDTGEYEMNDASPDAKEESNTILYKVAMIDRLIRLKDDPRKIYTRKPDAGKPDAGKAEAEPKLPKY